MDFLDYLTAFFSYVDIPALMLMFMLIAVWILLTKASGDQKIDLSDLLKEDGKLSMTNVTKAFALAFSGWFLMYDTIHNKQGDSISFLIYLAVWSGAPVADRLASALVAKWSK